MCKWQSCSEFKRSRSRDVLLFFRHNRVCNRSLQLKHEMTQNLDLIISLISSVTRNYVITSTVWRSVSRNQHVLTPATVLEELTNFMSMSISGSIDKLYKWCLSSSSTWNYSREGDCRFELVQWRHWSLLPCPWIAVDNRCGWFCRRVMSQPGWRRAGSVRVSAAEAAATRTSDASSFVNLPMFVAGLYNRRTCAGKRTDSTWLTTGARNWLVSS